MQNEKTEGVNGKQKKRTCENFKQKGKQDTLTSRLRKS